MELFLKGVFCIFGFFRFWKIYCSKTKGYSGIMSIASNVLIFSITVLKLQNDIFHSFRDMRPFYRPFFDIFSRFVQFFSYISRDIIIILQCWRLQSRDLKNYFYLRKKSTSQFFFHTHYNEVIGENRWFFGIIYPPAHRTESLSLKYMYLYYEVRCGNFYV